MRVYCFYAHLFVLTGKVEPMLTLICIATIIAAVMLLRRQRNVALAPVPVRVRRRRY